VEMSPHVIVFYETADLLAAGEARHLVEGGRTQHLDKRWSYRQEASHDTKMKQHVHLMLRGRQVCVINRNGTPSHNTTTGAVPRWVIDKIRARGLIESNILLETASADAVAGFTLPPSLIERAEARAHAFDLLEPVRRPLMRFREFLRRSGIRG